MAPLQRVRDGARADRPATEVVVLALAYRDETTVVEQRVAVPQRRDRLDARINRDRRRRTLAPPPPQLRDAAAGVATGVGQQDRVDLPDSVGLLAEVAREVEQDRRVVYHEQRALKSPRAAAARGTAACTGAEEAQMHTAIHLPGLPLRVGLSHPLRAVHHQALTSRR